MRSGGPDGVGRWARWGWVGYRVIRCQAWAQVGVRVRVRVGVRRGLGLNTWLAGVGTWLETGDGDLGSGPADRKWVRSPDQAATITVRGEGSGADLGLFLLGLRPLGLLLGLCLRGLLFLGLLLRSRCIHAGQAYFLGVSGVQVGLISIARVY